MSGASRANQRQSRTHKRQYDAYKNENRYTKNKCRKLLRVLKYNPNDTNAREALIRHGKSIGKDYANA